jgi:hypothetical protein
VSPPWIRPPLGTVPAVVPLELALARSDRFAVFVTHLAAYPEGFEFEVLAVAAPGQDVEDLPDPMLFGPGPRSHLRGRGGEIPDDVLLIGVQFSDGRKATNIGGSPPAPPEVETPPEAPVMMNGGDGGGGHWWMPGLTAFPDPRRRHQTEWVWPLPPPGPVAFVCQWPAVGIPLSRQEIDAQLILDASARAQVAFPGATPQLG